MLQKLDALYFSGKTWLACKANQFFRKEDGDVNIVSIVVIIAVVIVLAGIFREQIKSLIETLVQGITGKAKSELEI